MADGNAAADYRRLIDINEKLRLGEAVVMTVQDFKESLRKGKRYELRDIDMITTATHGIMSGTAAAFSVDVAPPGSYRKTARVWVNGVEGQPGPAPNERLGAADFSINGTEPSADAPKSYGGGDLFRDLVERKPVTVEVETESGRRLKREVTLDEFDFARYLSTRNVFKDYMVFGNFRTDGPIDSIFSPAPMTAATGVTAVGSGEFNPIQNDPALRTLRPGSMAFVNDAPGTVLGEGTRSKPARPSLSLAADMFDMDPFFMGGVRTPAGPEILNGVAIPIPVMDQPMLDAMCRALDGALPLPIADVGDRAPFAGTTYGEVWEGRDLAVTCDAARLAACGPDCRCVLICPTGALSAKPAPRWDRTRCTNCGACAAVCTSGAMSGDFGTVRVEGRAHRISYRTSDRTRAAELATRLKRRFEKEGLLLPIPGMGMGMEK